MDIGKREEWLYQYHTTASVINATFDYLFGSNLVPAKPLITASKASDDYPVTCDFSAGGAYA